jgi:hypothetical protein
MLVSRSTDLAQQLNHYQLTAVHPEKGRRHDPEAIETEPFVSATT